MTATPDLAEGRRLLDAYGAADFDGMKVAGTNWFYWANDNASALLAAAEERDRLREAQRLTPEERSLVETVVDHPLPGFAAPDVLMVGRRREVELLAVIDRLAAAEQGDQ